LTVSDPESGSFTRDFPQEPRFESDLEHDDDISLIELATVVMASRWRIVRWALIASIILVLPALFRPSTWTANASFVPEGSDASHTGILDLAGQFGVAIPGGRSGAAQSPQFYADLLHSRVILAPIIDSGVLAPNDARTAVPVLGLLLDAEPPFSSSQRERGLQLLRQAVKVSVSRNTGVVNVAVTTQWPSVSLAVTNDLLSGLNRFNLQKRQSQAAEERRFTEERLVAARASLTAAEERLGSFMERNRQFVNSPDLSFMFERLQRDVALQQQVLVGLAQAYEEVRMREVRDVPVLTVIEDPALPVRSNPRGRVKRALAGLLIGGFLAVLAAFAGEMLRRRLASRDPQVERFLATARDTRRGLMPWRQHPPSAGTRHRSGTISENVADAATL
jgi:uncharacterized protein involved in exopolysaccharide biosynthesis